MPLDKPPVLTVYSPLKLSSSINCPKVFRTSNRCLFELKDLQIKNLTSNIETLKTNLETQNIKIEHLKVLLKLKT